MQNKTKQYLLIEVDVLEKQYSLDIISELKSKGTLLTPDQTIEEKAMEYCGSNEYELSFYCAGATTQHAIDQLDKVRLLEWILSTTVALHEYNNEEILGLHEQSKNL